MNLSRFHVQPVDGVIRVPGPLRARITVEAENATRSAAGTAETHHAPLFHYTLDIPPGQTWQLPPSHATALTAALGANAGIRVVVEPAPDLRTLVPPVLAGRDLPCDLAVNELDDAACCGPRPCDPVPPGAMVAMPDMPALITIPARGGVAQPRYFDGLLLARADLETQQRRLRIEQQLQNRAHGSGVVWGLVPTYDGRDVTVGLGYGVDGCGNDLLVTTPYRVAIDALLADIGPLPQAGPIGLHLLLEYVETPEAPRPVHEECAPGISRTEPSRIRETVRLRLVTPRVFDGRGPIDDLLATGLVEHGETTVQPDVPFDLWVRMPGATLDFVLGTDQRMIVLPGSFSTDVELETRNKPDWTLTAATVRRDDRGDPAPPAQVAVLDTATGTVKWSMRGSTIDAFVDWRARHRDDPSGTYVGMTQLVLFVEIDTQELRLVSEITNVTREADPPGACSREPCTADAKLFATTPPWIHGFSDAPDTAADPRVHELALSELGLARTLEVDAPLQNAVRDLLGAWCRSLAWTGAGARTGGVVIGCLEIRDGRVTGVDPWGGRRSIVRPAWIDHVAVQLGVVAPSVWLSRLTSLACCAAKQPVPETPPPQVIERRIETGPVRARIDRVLAARTLPALLRPVATRLALALARRAPLAAIAGIESPVIDALRTAGVTTLHGLLSRDPDALLREVGSTRATAIARALASGEELADTIARAVADELTSQGSTSRATVDREKLAHTLARALEKLRETIEPAIAESFA